MISRENLLEQQLREKDKEIEDIRSKWYDDCEKYLLEIERLKEQSNNYVKRIIKAIEYLENHKLYIIPTDLLDILEGEDKE